MKEAVLGRMQCTSVSCNLPGYCLGDIQATPHKQCPIGVPMQHITRHCLDNPFEQPVKMSFRKGLCHTCIQYGTVHRRGWSCSPR